MFNFFEVSNWWNPIQVKLNIFFNIKIVVKSSNWIEHNQPTLMKLNQIVKLGWSQNFREEAHMKSNIKLRYGRKSRRMIKQWS